MIHSTGSKVFTTLRVESEFILTNSRFHESSGEIFHGTGGELHLCPLADARLVPRYLRRIENLNWAASGKA